MIGRVMESLKRLLSRYDQWCFKKIDLAAIGQRDLREAEGGQEWSQLEALTDVR